MRSRRHESVARLAYRPGSRPRLGRFRAIPWRSLRDLSMRSVGLSSHVLVVPRMAVSFGVERDDGLMDRAVEVIRAGEGLVSQGMPLQVAPDPFDVVQLRSVFRQPLDREPVSALGEGGTGGFAGVDRA